MPLTLQDGNVCSAQECARDCLSESDVSISVEEGLGLCRYFLNSKCEWYATAFEGTFEISMTCLVVFSVLVSPSLHELSRDDLHVMLVSNDPFSNTIDT